MVGWNGGEALTGRGLRGNAAWWPWRGTVAMDWTGGGRDTRGRLHNDGSGLRRGPTGLGRPTIGFLNFSKRLGRYGDTPIMEEILSC